MELVIYMISFLMRIASESQYHGLHIDNAGFLEGVIQHRDAAHANAQGVLRLNALGELARGAYRIRNFVDVFARELEGYVDAGYVGFGLD